MAIGSTSYSDISEEITKLIEEFRQRNTLCDLLVLILAVSLMIISGLTHLAALELFDDGLSWSSQLLMAVIGGVYIAESFVLIANFFYFRVRLVIVIAVMISMVSLAVGVIRIIDSSNGWKSYFVLFPLIADVLIIWSLSYSAWTMDQNTAAPTHNEYVRLEFDSSVRRQNMKIVVSNADYLGPRKRTESECSDAHSMVINFNTNGMDMGEEELHGTMTSFSKSNSESAVKSRDEDDEKAEELVTAGANGSGEFKKANV